MGIDLHFRKSVLISLVEHELQNRLRAACIPPDSTGQNFIDHLDVVPTPTVNVNSTRVLFTVQFDTYMVTRASMDPGTTIGTVDPAEAHSPIALSPRPSIDVELIFTGSYISLVCRRVNTTASQLLPFRDSILSAITFDGELASFAIDKITDRIGIPRPTFSRFADLGASIVVQTGSATPVPRLGSTQDWGIFFDREAHESAVEAMLDTAITRARAEMDSISLTTLCEPNGRVLAEISGLKTITTPRLGVFHVTIRIPLTIDTSLIPGRVPEFQLRSTWTATGRARTGEPILNWDNEAERIARIALDPSGLTGFTAINDHAFLFTRSLPATSFGDASLSLGILIPTIDVRSFTLTGRFSSLPALDKSVPSFQVHPFPASYSQEVSCRHPSSTVQPAEAFTALLPSYPVSTKICSVQLLSPTPAQVPLQSLGLFNPTTGAVWIPYAQAPSLLTLGTQVKILIRTSRGVRIVNYGLPPDPRFDAAGNPTNVVLHFSLDCLPQWKVYNRRYLIFGRWAVKLDQPRPPIEILDLGLGLTRAESHHHEVYCFRTGLLTWARGPEESDGLVLEQAAPGVEGGLGGVARSSVFLPGPGTATVLVPTFVLVGGGNATSEGPRLSWISGKEVTGAVTSHTKTFTRLVTLTRGKDAVDHRLTVQVVNGLEIAIVTTTFKDGRVEATMVTGDGKVEVAKQQVADSGNTIAQGEDMIEKWKVDGLEVKAVYPVPGFESELVAIAELGAQEGGDAGYRLLTRTTKDGTISVSGMMDRWLRFSPVAVGQWGISGTKGEHVSVYRVTDNGKEELAGGGGLIEVSDSQIPSEEKVACGCKH